MARQRHFWAASRLGTALACAWALMGATTPSRADNLVGVTQGPNPTLFSLNAQTGAASAIGAAGGIGGQVSALAFSTTDTTLYAGTLDGSVLRINAATGMNTLLGATGSSNSLFGLTFVGSTLYGLQGASGGAENLVRINTQTGAATTLGQIQDSGGSLLAGRGLVALNGKLVTADAGLGAGGYFFSLDPTTGLATEITQGGPGLDMNGLSGLAFANNTLFAFNNDPNNLGLFQVDPLSANAVKIGGSNLRIGAIVGVAVVPEPGVMVVFLVGFVVLAAVRRVRLVRGGSL